MFRIGLSIVVLTSWFAAPLQQMPSPAAPPNFAGTWVPAEPARSNVLFNNGLGWVSGNGSIVIEQRTNRLSVTRYVPDNILDSLLLIHGQFFPTVIYRIVEPRGRSGGSGAGGDQRGSSWQGERLVLTQSRSGVRLITVSLSLDGERLKLETHTVIAGEGHPPPRVVRVGVG